MRVETAVLAALVPTISFLAATAPEPFGVRVGGASVASSAGANAGSWLALARDKLVVGATVHYLGSKTEAAKKLLLAAATANANAAAAAAAAGRGRGSKWVGGGATPSNMGLFGALDEHIHHGIVTEVDEYYSAGVGPGVVMGSSAQVPDNAVLLRVQRPDGHRDELLSTNVVYLNPPSVSYGSTAGLAEDEGVLFDGHDESDYDHGEDQYADPDSAEVGSLTSPAHGGHGGHQLKTAHLLTLLRYLTNSIVGDRIIPQPRPGTESRVPAAAVANSTMAGDASTTTRDAVILDLQRLVGQSSWLLYAACQHNMLAWRGGEHKNMSDPIVEQLEELRNLLIYDEESCGVPLAGTRGGAGAGAGTGGTPAAARMGRRSSEGYISKWFGGEKHLQAIKMLVDNPAFRPPVSGPGSAKLQPVEAQKYLEWIEYRDWLVDQIAQCRQLIAHTVPEKKAENGGRRRPAMQMETI